jgi:hypothetical protein
MVYVAGENNGIVRNIKMQHSPEQAVVSCDSEIYGLPEIVDSAVAFAERPI